MKRAIVVILPIIALVVLGFLGLTALEANKPVAETSTEQRQALAVFAEQVERRDLVLEVTAQGEVRPRSEIVLTPLVSGRIAYLSDKFENGGYIPKGEIIARLDSADYELSIVRAKAGIATAQQRLYREQAESELAVRDLQELGVADSSPLARREPQLQEAQAMLASAQAQLDEAELALSRTVIRSPFNARVREKSADVGQFVTQSQGLGRIFSTESVEIQLPVTDAQLGQLGLPIAFAHTEANPGPVVTFTATVAGKPRTWTGRITRTAAAVNSQSRLINIFGEVIDPYGAGSDDGTPIAPGLFVTATIAGDTIEDVLWAPRSALRGNNNLFIGDQKAGLLNIRTIDVLYSDTTGVYFPSGAEAGELAVVSPVQAAFDGMRLQIRERRPDGSLVDEPESQDEDREAVLASGSTAETAQ